MVLSLHLLLFALFIVVEVLLVIGFLRVIVLWLITTIIVCAEAVLVDEFQVLLRRLVETFFDLIVDRPYLFLIILDLQYLLVIIR